MTHQSKFPGYYLFEYAFLRGIIFLLGLFPISVSHSLARSTAALVYRLSPKRKKKTLDNLDLAFGDTKSKEEKNQIARASFQTAALSFIEFLTIEKKIKGQPEKYFEFTGTEHLEEAFRLGKGVVLVISHLGSWEYLAFLPFLRGYPCSVVVRPIKNPYVYRWAQRLRRSTKLNPIDKNKSVKKILRELKSNHLVALLIDQWAGNDGIWVDFFGTPTSTTSVPARLANKYGTVLVPAYCLRTRQGYYQIRIEPSIHIESGENWEARSTLKLNRQLEEMIRSFPEQWIWSHHRWRPKNLANSL